MSRGRLARYSLWQFRDFAIDRGIAIMIIGLLWGYTLIEPLRRTMGAAFAIGPGSPAWPLVITVTSSIVSVSVLIALNGIVSNDRKMGYYRFLFSKPVTPVAYYTQLFFVYMAGVLIAMLLLSGVLHTVVAGFNIVNYVLYAAVIYIAPRAGLLVSDLESMRANVREDAANENQKRAVCAACCFR